MPFTSDQFLAQLDQTLASNRLAHGYLLTGLSASSLETTAARMADKLLGAPSAQHPDAHWVAPQSKTRRYATEQIRELEGKLYLKPYQADRKVAVLAHAERMCQGRAEPANAFLKTLEEPPAQTVLILWSSQPQTLLPTILSRCVRVEIRVTEVLALPAPLQDFLTRWGAVSGRVPEIRAYQRSSLLARYWAERRGALEESVVDEENEESDAEGQKALLEGEFALERQTTIAALEEWYWQKEQAALQQNVGTDQASSSLRAIHSLELLQESLQRNVDVTLAIEVACLKIEKCLAL